MILSVIKENEKKATFSQSRKNTLNMKSARIGTGQGLVLKNADCLDSINAKANS